MFAFPPANRVFVSVAIAQLEVRAGEPRSKDDRGDQRRPRLEEIDGVCAVAYLL